MRFLMLMIPAVYQPGAAPHPVQTTGVPDADAVARMMKLNEDLHAAGALLALDGLHPLSKGARVSYRGGKPVVTDGPFAEAKEVVGGYWIIKAGSLDEALGWARRIPAADGDIVEVRQIQEMSDFPEEIVDAVKDNAPNVSRDMGAL
jgi:hypothetical protein